MIKRYIPLCKYIPFGSIFIRLVYLLKKIAMLKRTKGRFLLTLLVITGMAGTITSSSLSKEERKFAISTIKKNKEEVLNSVKGLSEKQLSYKPGADRWNIKECVYHIVLTDKSLWHSLDSVMKLPTNGEDRKDIVINDETLLKSMLDRSQKNTAPEMLQPIKAPWAEVKEATSDFKSDKTHQLKYLRSTTEDFRNRVIQFPYGSIDAYQFLLFANAHIERHVLQIKEIKNDPSFPKE